MQSIRAPRLGFQLKISAVANAETKIKIPMPDNFAGYQKNQGEEKFQPHVGDR